ncbi:NAD(+) diphosphatase [Actinoplanes sp. N902-109]|uniref:NAD(+) diphosphatase n=1 Tax=Actinoplanes sp. (strain N902-109) TaxID=649831 RepID=UPI000329611C|nr:NAD(+) diphosphatase [Actinoplanes sp. N902-109]AGL20777.1 nudix hydrolase [Actinoplanes sp. N902-109]
MTGAGGPPLARTSLDRAAHHRKDDAWLDQAWKTGLVLVIDIAKGGRVPLSGLDAGTPALALISSDTAPEGERLFLGVDPAGTPIFAIDAPLPAQDGGTGTLRDIGHLLDVRDAGILTTAAALGNWHASHRFSPRNGQPTTVIEAGWSRVDADGRAMWPRTDPAMIVLVHDGVAGPQGRCLLGHNATWPVVDGVKRFSCLAGYVEPGESAESAVTREVREEVGIGLDSISYEGSQSWPYPGSLMLGYTARADREQPITVDPEEIDDARWFTREQVSLMIREELVDDGVRLTLPMASSIARYLIEGWLTA